MRTPESPKTLYDKIFDEHVVRMEEDALQPSTSTVIWSTK